MELEKIFDTVKIPSSPHVSCSKLCNFFPHRIVLNNSHETQLIPRGMRLEKRQCKEREKSEHYIEEGSISLEHFF